MLRRGSHAPERIRQVGRMRQIGTYLVARRRVTLSGMAALVVAAALYAWVGATPAYACTDGGNYNFNENWNYNENWNFNSNTNTNINTNTNSNFNYNSTSGSSTTVTIRTTISG